MKDLFDPTLADDTKQRIMRLHPESERTSERDEQKYARKFPLVSVFVLANATAAAEDGRVSRQ
jgi:hypothetical protein